jgi:hypothetical protein
MAGFANFTAGIGKNVFLNRRHIPAFHDLTYGVVLYKFAKKAYNSKNARVAEPWDSRRVSCGNYCTGSL